MTVRIPFWKLQSIGNDFPLLHIQDLEELLPREELDSHLERLAIKMADRRFGVGGDGLLAAKPLSDDRVLLRMFNPDGTEDFCGNGLRCAAVHAHTLGWVGQRFSIEHLGRNVGVSIEDGRVTTKLGGATYDPALIPVRGGELFRAALPGGRTGSALSTGSAHLVVWVDELPGDEDFCRESPLLETHELFPERTSVMWTKLVAQDHLRLRIWERGVGETQGCGTGSTAAAVDYLRGEGRAGRVQVDNPGGTIFISWDPARNETEIEGFAEQVYTGEYRLLGA